MGRDFAVPMGVSVAEYLADVEFPTSKQEVLRSAQLQDAHEEVSRLLRRLRNQHYTNLTEVMNTLRNTPVRPGERLAALIVDSERAGARDVEVPHRARESLGRAHGGPGPTRILRTPGMIGVSSGEAACSIG